MVRVTRKSATESRGSQSASLPNGMSFAVVIESPIGKKKQALLSQYINFADTGKNGNDHSVISSRKQRTVDNPALAEDHADASIVSDAKEISSQKIQQSMLHSTIKEASKATNIHGAVGRVNKQTPMKGFASSQLSYQTQDRNDSKRRRIADDKMSSNIKQSNKSPSSHNNRDRKSDNNKSSQDNVNLDPSSQNTCLSVKEQLIREWEAQQDAESTTVQRIPASNGAGRDTLMQPHQNIDEPFVLQNPASWTAFDSDILGVKEDLDSTRPTAPIAPPLFGHSKPEPSMLFLKNDSSPISGRKKALISTMSSPISRAPNISSAQASKISSSVIIDLDNAGGNIISPGTTKKKEKLILESSRPPLKLHSGTSMTSSMVRNKHHKPATIQKTDEAANISNLQQKVTRIEDREISSRGDSQVTKPKPAAAVLVEGSSSSDELGLFKERPKKAERKESAIQATPLKPLAKKATVQDSGGPSNGSSAKATPSSTLKPKNERRTALEALRAQKIKKMNPVRKRAEFDTPSDSDSSISSPEEDVPFSERMISSTKSRTSSKKPHPLTSEDDADFVVSDPEDAEVLTLPEQFTLESRMDPKEAFKVVVLWCLFVLLVPDFDPDEENFKSATRSLVRKVDSFRFSLLESALWTGSFKAAMGRPNFVGRTLEGEGKKCDACRRLHTGTTHVAQFSGPRYDPNTLQDHGESDQDDSEDSAGNAIPHEEQEFHLGVSCYKKTELAHKFRHWRKSLLNNVQRYLKEYDLLEDYAVNIRNKMPPQNRQKFVNNIMIQFEADGKVDQYFYKFNRDLTNAEKWRIGKNGSA